MSKVWFITGANRGLGFEIAKAALAAGDKVVATGRDTAKTVAAFGGESDSLVVAKLDVTERAGIQAAIDKAVAHFGRIDVLVNNAGFGQLGVFEELSPEDIDYQFRVNVFGVFDVTRAVLPVMRKQRSGHIFNITSIGGLRGGAGYSMYASTKFALEGFSESLSLELAAFGIHVTAVEPGYFRTDFLDASSIKHSQNAIADYAESTAAAREFMEGRNHNQQGDPAKLALTMLELVKAPEPPQHFVVGTDAVGVLETRIQRDTEQLATWRALSSSTDFVE